MRHVRGAICLLSFALLAPVLGCAKGSDASGTGGTGNAGTAGSAGGATGTGGMGGSVVDDPFSGLPAAKALHVQGNLLKDATGATVRLLGVNRDGSEYMCTPPTTGGSTFDGSTGPTSITSMLTWNINTVRLPLNEHCWLGLNGSLIGADEYQAAIVDYVVRLHQKNLYVVLDLHWSAPGSTVITGGSNGNQLVTMAYADHAIAFWTSVATTFKNDPMVIFDLFNEPILDSSRPFWERPRVGSVGMLAERVQHIEGDDDRHAADAERRAGGRRYATRGAGRNRLGTQARPVAAKEAVTIRRTI